MNKKLYTKCTRCHTSDITSVGSTLKDNSKCYSYFSFELPNSRLLAAVSIMLITLLSTTLFGKVGIIVNKDLYSSISAAVTQYIADVQTIEGKEVWLDKDNFTDANTVSELKSAFQEHFQNDDLEGVVLIGDLPIPIYDIEGDNFACDHYYQDMDGSWGGSGNTFTSHTGDKEGEIWISRITASVLEEYGGFGNEVDIVNDYFDRVTKRMHGQDAQPRTYVIAGQYWQWKGLESENIGDMGYDSDKIEKYRSEADNTTSNHACGEKWMDAIKRGMEYGYIYSHSSPTSHSIGVNLQDLANEEINCRFFNSYACSNGDYERGNMCGGYALSDNGLVCVGSSKTGSMRPGTFGYYNTPLGEGKNFGEAFLEWYNTGTVLDDKYWHYGMNLQGVGTLYLEPYPGGPYISLSYPRGGEEWETNCSYDILWSSNVGGNVKIDLLKGGSVKETLASSTANNGSLTWSIPANFETGDDFKVKVTSLDNDTCISESQSNFKIIPEYIISSFTYFENFDTLEAETQILPYKYEQLTTDDNNWTVWSGPTPSRIDDPPDVTGPEADHTTGQSGNYLYTEASASASGNPNKKFDYITPKFNFKALKNPQLSFWYHMLSDNAGEDHMGDLCIDISVDGTWQNEVIKISGNKGDTWYEQVLDLNPYRGDRVIFRFSGITGDSWESDICIDDIRVGEDPTSISDNVHSVPISYDLKLYGSRLHFQIPANGKQVQHISMKLYNVQGKLVRALLDGNVKAGYHSIAIDGRKLAAGLYLCKMRVGEFTKTINLLLRK